MRLQRRRALFSFALALLNFDSSPEYPQATRGTDVRRTAVRLRVPIRVITDSFEVRPPPRLSRRKPISNSRGGFATVR